MEKYRDSFGFINIEQMDIDAVQYIRDNKKIFSFWYKGRKYFFKYVKNIENIYNELIASEIARSYGLDFVNYDLGSVRGQIGVFSENFLQPEDLYVSMESILKSYYQVESVDCHNNLEDIWLALEYYFNDANVVANLMDQIVDLFLFDVLIGNVDRHVENFGIIKRNDEYKLTPVFDNELMLSYSCIFEGIYCLGVNQDDHYPFVHDYVKVDNMLDKFLAYSDSKYLDRLKDKVCLISDDNIEKLLCKIEESLNFKMNEHVREKIGDDFFDNKRMISRIINKHSGMRLIKKGNV